MLGAFQSFEDELRRAYPCGHKLGDFEVVMTRLGRISVSDNELVVGLSDHCVNIARSPWPASKKLFFIEKAIEDFGREMSDLNS
jgi:3-methyladenine DNA glycosylase AlkC